MLKKKKTNYDKIQQGMTKQRCSWSTEKKATLFLSIYFFCHEGENLKRYKQETRLSG